MLLRIFICRVPCSQSCVLTELSAVLMYYGPYRPNLGLLSDAVLVLTSPGTWPSSAADSACCHYCCQVNPAMSVPQIATCWAQKCQRARCFCLWLGIKLLRGQRFLLDCSWTWKASQTRIYCESYRMIQLLLVTWIPFLDTVTVNTQRTNNSIQSNKIQNDV